MNKAGRITSLKPAASIPGGEVLIECEGFDTSNRREIACTFDDVRGRIVSALPHRVLAVVPENVSGEVITRLANGMETSEAARIVIGRKLADELHPVANPAYDPEDGSLYVTRSGSRGQQLPTTLFRIDSNGELEEFSGEIMNPTGIAFSPSGEMFVTSRAEGVVYRVKRNGEITQFAQNMNIATGLTFDREGRMYVGDRTGTIYRVNGIGDETPWAELEPSVSAYHLAFGPDDFMYVSGPTVSSHESILKIDPNGNVSEFFKGLGRPQGLAFDSKGNLYVAASYQGRRGIVKISPDGKSCELAIAGMNVVGLAFGSNGDMCVATNDSIYTVAVGIYGTLLN
jgi:sugar lactone lactonase YvrE